MDDEINKYAANLSRLSQSLPGISLIDVLETGNVHVHDPQTWAASSVQSDLYVWLTERANQTAIRYVVVEDLIPEMCRTLGAAFDLVPLFYNDHFNNEADMHAPGMHPLGSGAQVCATSGLLVTQAALNTAVEEWASVYQVTKDGHGYGIILSDPVPECSQTFWNTTDPIAAYHGAPPPDAQTRTIPLFRCIVPRLPPDITSSQSITSIPDSMLVSFYKTISSTATSLRDYTQRPQKNELSLESLLFHIVISDTKAVLQLLQTMRGDNIRAIISWYAQLNDVVRLQASIANLQSQVPDLGSQLGKPLRALLDLFPNEDAHRTAITQFGQINRDLGVALGFITGALQIMESQRAITEAESVTRLTELAFFFIPLFFAAAVFSMQVRELADGPQL
ncbi:hypothetical protein BJX65DRAFT_313833 [Aspergillus insuetus]